MRTSIKNSITDDAFVLASTVTSKDFWRFGKDNLLPYSLAFMARSVPTHRRIINDKTSYTLGQGFTCDEKNKDLLAIIERANRNESLYNVMDNVLLDYNMGGNAYIEVITNARKSFMVFYHQDFTKCRLNKEKNGVILNSDWIYNNKSKWEELPLFPQFKFKDGFMRSIIHIKDYEPMFQNYGMPQYLSGLNVSAIAYKTDKWNISRLDNSFQLSGVMEIDSDAQADDPELIKLKNDLESKFSGKPGQVMFMIKNMVDKDRGNKFTPMQSDNEGDWTQLHEISNNDLIVAHQWYKELSGFDFTTGFNADRILNAYEVAMNILIRPLQNKFLREITRALDVIGVDGSTLAFINKPPITAKPNYMKIWEARKADGLEYDENDPSQQLYLSQINGTTNNSK